MTRLSEDEIQELRIIAEEAGNGEADMETLSDLATRDLPRILDEIEALCATQYPIDAAFSRLGLARDAMAPDDVVVVQIFLREWRKAVAP